MTNLVQFKNLEQKKERVSFVAEIEKAFQASYNAYQKEAVITFSEQKKLSEKDKGHVIMMLLTRFSALPSPKNVADTINTLQEKQREKAEAAKPKIDYTKQKWVWEKREEKIKQEVDEFLKRFKTFALFRTATTEGWDYDLLKFAKECAIFQACLIHESHARYSSVIFGNNIWNGDLPKFLSELRRGTKERGLIEFDIPSEGIEYWKEIAIKRTERG